MMKPGTATLAPAVFLLLVVATVVAGTKDCNETVLNLCDDYRTLYDSYMKADHDKIKLDRQLVNDACSKAEGLRECVASSSCRDHFDGLVGRFTDTISYVCSDNVKPVFLDDLDCARQSSTRRKLISCDHHFYANDSSIDKCQQHQDFYACREGVFASFCNAEFARVYIAAHLKLNKDPCQTSDAAGVTAYQRFASMWMVSFVVWTLLTRWLTFW